MIEPDPDRPTVGAYALSQLSRYPDRIAFSWPGGELTYAATLDVIGRLQRVFDRRGLRAGQRIAILSGNRVESWCVATAAAASGLSYTYLHLMGSLDDHVYQLQDSEAVLLIVDTARFVDRATAIAERVSTADFVVGMDASGLGPGLWAEIDSVGASSPADVDPAAPVVWLNYSGGTTGRPKGVPYSHANILSQVTALLSDFELPERPIYLAAAPITHVAGTLIIPVLARGGTVHLMDGYSPSQALELIERERINTLLLVPTMLYALMDDPTFQTRDLTSIEILLYGAAAISPHRLRQGLTRLGQVFAQLYGQSECYPIAYLPKAAHIVSDDRLLTSCGLPVTGAEVALLDSDDHPVAIGETGEICVRGTSVMDGYWKLPELTAETLSNGWLHTGDLARADERGYLYIVDRKKDMIVSGGFNVFPREVEDVLTSHPGVAAAAVYGVPDPHWGESVTAAVVLRPGVDVPVGELLSLVKERKGGFQTPKTLTVVDALPMTAVGKVDKKALRKSHERSPKGGPA